MAGSSRDRRGQEERVNKAGQKYHHGTVDQGAGKIIEDHKGYRRTT